MAEYQIYYQWQKANAKSWRCHPDPVISAHLLLAKTDAYGNWEKQFGNVHGLAIFISSSIKMLSGIAVELAIDETYGTNSAGMGLFTVLAEVDGAGIPVAYLLVEVKPNKNGKKKADSGAMIQLLQEFLGPLKSAGFNPTFFGCDKDQSEITAIQLTWPHSTKVQLCLWHAKRALQNRLLSSEKTATQAKYHPDEVQRVLPEVEICWGSVLLRRPDGEHRREQCRCVSKKRESTFGANGRLEVRSKEERALVVGMFISHYNRHSTFPDAKGAYHSPEVIYSQCVREVYDWCRKRDYFRLWSYMWINWYCPAKWRLWARSVSEQVSVLKTTMIVESHWRKVKHDYLHRFNRPRIDLVTWVLCSRVIPDSVHFLQALTSPNSPEHRYTWASWRKKWKSESDKLEIRAAEVDKTKVLSRHTDPRRFVCSCEAFLNSRFLLCKHIVRCYKPMGRPGRLSWKRKVHRRRSPPFWFIPNMEIRDEFSDVFPPLQDDENPTGGLLRHDTMTQFAASTEPDSESESESEDEFETLEKIGQQLQKFQAIYHGGLQEGNARFVKSVVRMHRLEKISSLLKDIDEISHQRSHPKTWRDNEHPSTIFYNK